MSATTTRSITAGVLALATLLTMESAHPGDANIDATENNDAKVNVRVSARDDEGPLKSIDVMLRTDAGTSRGSKTDSDGIVEFDVPAFDSAEVTVSSDACKLDAKLEADGDDPVEHESVFARLRVIVVSDEGEAIEDARIKVYADDRELTSGLTDADGGAAFSGLCPNDRVRIVVIKRNWETSSERDVRLDGATSRRIELEPRSN